MQSALGCFRFDVHTARSKEYICRQHCVQSSRCYAACLSLSLNYSPEISFEFMAEDFGNCSSFCGDGTQSRDVQCVMVVDGMVNQTLNDTECSDVDRPNDEQSCNSGACPVYLDNGFGDVSWEDWFYWF